MNQLVRKASIQEICGHRARALELYRSGMESLQEAQKAHGRAQPSQGYITLPDDLRRAVGYGSADHVNSFMTTIRPMIDRDIWRSLMDYTNLGSMMDLQEKKQFFAELDKDPPEVTPENVAATMERLLGESEMIFKRGLVNVFSKLCRDYKSNDGFKIGERTVITYGVTYDTCMGWFRFCTHAEDMLRDVDRVIHILDDKPAPTTTAGLAPALYEKMRGFKKDRKPSEMVVETEYWRAKFFKNGNIHLWSKRPDLIVKANRIIADHFGAVLGASFAAKAADRPFEPHHKDYNGDDQNFFATPPEVVAKILAAADIQPHHRVVEPEAGEGAIALAVAARLTEQHTLTCFEINEDRCRALANALPDTACLLMDVLESTPEPVFDRVVMNPPFSKGQDIRHVFHAYKFLKPGGRLVAIMSGGTEFRSDKTTVGFRDWLTSLGGIIEPLPEGSFKSSGTSVHTVMVTIDKSGEPA